MTEAERRDRRAARYRANRAKDAAYLWWSTWSEKTDKLTTIVELYELEELTIEQIADRVELSERTIHRWLLGKVPDAMKVVRDPSDPGNGYPLRLSGEVYRQRGPKKRRRRSA